MAKKSVIERNKKRQRLADKYAVKRAALKAIAKDEGASPEDRFNAWLKLAELPRNSSQTRVKLRSVVFSILAEVGYLKDTRSLLLQNVFVDRELSNYLKDRGEAYVLRCLEVAG